MIPDDSIIIYLYLDHTFRRLIGSYSRFDTKQDLLDYVQNTFQSSWVSEAIVELLNGSRISAINIGWDNPSGMTAAILHTGVTPADLSQVRRVRGYDTMGGIRRFKNEIEA